MHLPLLPSISNSQVYVQGDVSIDASAAIAPGVILQADPDSRIIIAAGVCIGMGTILHAHKGTLEVETGAVLGSAVLLIGQGKIGTHACIGAATTIWNNSVDAWQVVPPASLLGDRSRPVPEAADAVTEEAATAAETPEANPSQESDLPNSPPTPATDSLAQQPSESPSTTVGVSVYGQAHLNQLLLTLFPHRKSVNPPADDD